VLPQRLVTLLRALLDNDKRKEQARADNDKRMARANDPAVEEIRHLKELRERRVKARNMRQLEGNAQKLKDIEQKLNEIMI